MVRRWKEGRTHEESVMRAWLTAVLALLMTASAYAHIMVSPPASKAGVTQKYELRVHNEGKVATTSLDLEIPDGITILDVATVLAGHYDTTKTGTRITAISWQVEVPPSKYVALGFTAKNPDGAKDVRWNVRQHLADGSIIEWSDKPGAKEKASVTKIGAAAS
jgi:uncharacterized protein YcnI